MIILNKNFKCYYNQFTTNYNKWKKFNIRIFNIIQEFFRNWIVKNYSDIRDVYAANFKQ